MKLLVAILLLAGCGMVERTAWKRVYKGKDK
jgi:hypothetical protein